MLTRARYGIDAPQLVRAFLLIGAALLAVSAILFATANDQQKWVFWIALILLIPGLYALGMFCLMLFESLITKVRGRSAILDLVPWNGDETVLDVGCGRGLMLVGAAARLTTGKAIGIDIWLERDQSANNPAQPLENARIEGVSDRVTVETADMRNLPFVDQSFDVILSNWVVHNLEAKADRTQALAEMVRVLRPSGTILLTDIVNRDEYLTELRRLGLGYTQLVVPSVAKDRFLRTVSFGSYQPATIVARKSSTNV